MRFFLAPPCPSLAFEVAQGVDLGGERRVLDERLER
jgi:hypothetical protein